MHYIIFDLEFNQAYRCRTNEIVKQEIVEIGAVKLSEDLTIIDTFQSYISPKLYRKLNPYVQKTTNLSMEKLEKEGKSFPEIINKFIKWLGEYFILYSWGLDDIRELRNNCTLYNVDTKWIEKFIDVQRIYTEIYQLPNRISLNKAVDNLNIQIDSDFHSALNDALYTAEIFKKIFEKAKMGEASLDQLDHQIAFNKQQKKEFFEQHRYRVNCPKCGRFTKKLFKNMKNSSLVATHLCKNCKIKVRYKATPVKEQDNIVIKTQVKKIKEKDPQE